jgi:hypothetical protein
MVAAMMSADPYARLDAFLSEHQLCRPGFDEPDMSETLVTLSCGCGARIAAWLPPVPARG